MINTTALRKNRYQYYNMQVFDWNSKDNRRKSVQSKYQYYNMQVFDWNIAPDWYCTKVMEVSVL